MSDKNEQQKKSATKPPKCPWCGTTTKFMVDMIKHEKTGPKRPVKYQEA